MRSRPKHIASLHLAMCLCAEQLTPSKHVRWQELPDSESLRHVLLYILEVFKGHPYVQPGHTSMVILYDDMCHLLRQMVTNPLGPCKPSNFDHSHTAEVL